MLQAQPAAVQHHDAGQLEVVDVALQLQRPFAARRESGPRCARRKRMHLLAARNRSRRERPIPIGETELALGLTPAGQQALTQGLQVDLGG